MVSRRSVSLSSSGPGLQLFSAVHFTLQALTPIELSPCSSLRLNVLLSPLKNGCK